jgi:hypothetical protein
MGEAPKSYYQVSFTGTQALIALFVLLTGLAVSFYLGARAGFSGTRAAAPPRVSSPPAAPVPAPVPAPPVPPTAASASAASASPAPVVAESFEDREAGVSEESAAGPPSRTELASGSATAAPSPKSPAKVESAPPAKAPAFYVQVLSTHSKSEAVRWKERLAGKKYRAAVSAVDSSKGRMYRVRVGPYADRDQAKKAAAKISAEEKHAAWVAPAE